MRRDAFQAIADPNRRNIIDLIANRPLNLNAVAESFNISRPAISKHIKILAECGLVVITQKGRERYCEATLQNLNEVSEWVEQHRLFWTSKMDALDDFLKTQLVKKSKPSRKQAIRKPIKKKKNEK
jgi:DNA-binding transcriptional ArsR family regulator